MLTRLVSNEHFCFKSAEVSVVECNLYFCIADIKDYPFPPTPQFVKIKWGFNLRLNVPVVENLWFLLRGSL